MNQRKLTFDFQNLVVDYITFKFQDLDSETKTQIVDHLSNLEFNSYQESAKLSKPIQEPIQTISQNQFKALFLIDNLY